MFSVENMVLAGLRIRLYFEPKVAGFSQHIILILNFIFSRQKDKNLKKTNLLVYLYILMQKIENNLNSVTNHNLPCLNLEFVQICENYCRIKWSGSTDVPSPHPKYNAIT
jgi:hypothetical protein